MCTVAVIPARGNSKGIPKKNLRELGGVPLVARTIRAAKASRSVDHVFVSSDDTEILAVARSWGAKCIVRPEAIANDTATSESALLHAIEIIMDKGIGPDVLVFLQCTSPFTTPEDIDAVVSSLNSQKADSAFSVIEDHGFIWSIDADGNAVGVTHDHKQGRKRRQDLEKRFRETGAIYVMRVESFLKDKQRFCGASIPVQLSHPISLEIDTYDDLFIADTLCWHFDRKIFKETKAKFVSVIVTDFDGVHTDDKVVVDETGKESVICSRSDGYGVEMLQKMGYQTLVLSKERNPVVTHRAKKLNMEVLQGVDQKFKILNQWRLKKGFEWKQIAYMGNDVTDIECMKVVGLSIAPSNAHADVLAITNVILPKRGGDGALRLLTNIFSEPSSTLSG